MVRIKPVLSRGDKRIFINLPWKLYDFDKNWVAALENGYGGTPSIPRRIPCCAWAHTSISSPIAMIARSDGSARASTSISTRVKGFKGGYLALFESENDYETAAALFDAATSWLRERQMEFITGPQSPSNGDDYRGLLIEGFDSPPVLYDSYNPKYYVTFFEKYGFTKDFDRNAYYMELGDPEPNVVRAVTYAQKRYKFTTRRFNLKKIDAELLGMKDVLDAGWPRGLAGYGAANLQRVAGRIQEAEAFR